MITFTFQKAIVKNCLNFRKFDVKKSKPETNYKKINVEFTKKFLL